MSAPEAGPVLAAAADALARALRAEPGAVLEDIARRLGVTYRTVLDALEPGQARALPGARFEDVWRELAAWPGEAMFIVHTRDGVFETRGAIPPGNPGRGFFNFHGASPIGGHIRADRCAAIYLVDRPLFGRRSCSVQFVNHEGEPMFKVFVGRDAARELDPAQVAAFEALAGALA